jgi:hypothetical protein
MRKQINTVTLVLAVLTLLAFQSCKEDTSPPTITIVGSHDTTIAKNTVYVDPGATAEDDKDESVYVISDFSSTNPDESITGAYNILYKAQDRNANMATDTRIVNVTLTGASLANNYAVVDTSQIDTLAYSSSFTQNILDEFQIYINNLMNFFSGSTYANVKANTITIPLQRPNGTFSQYKVSGSGTINEVPPNIIIDIHYSVEDTTGAPTLYRHAVFVY